MNEKVHAIINPDCCDTCVHNEVCGYKRDWLDICNALSKCEVVKQLGSQGMSSKKVTLYDILGEVVIKCKHYYNGEKIRQDSGSITFQSYPPVTNPCDATSTSSQTSTDPRDWVGTYTLTNN